MEAPGRFALFGDLPSELRLQIWTEALSVYSVWVPMREKFPSACRVAQEPSPVWVETNEHLPGCCCDVKKHAFVAHFVGSSPLPVSQSCTEARGQWERLCVKPIRESPIITNPRAYWVDLARTVVYLGAVGEMDLLFQSIGPEEASRFKHVAVDVYPASPPPALVEIFNRLARACPGLETTILHFGWSPNRHFSVPLRERLSPDKAACIASIPKHTGTEPGDGLEPVTAKMQADVTSVFGVSPPSLYVVPVDPGHR